MATDDPRRADGTGVPALPESRPTQGEPEQGDNQDVAVEKIYPTDPTGVDPREKPAGS